MENNKNNAVIAFEDMSKVKCNVDIRYDFDDKYTPFTIDLGTKASASMKKRTIDVHVASQNQEEEFVVYINGKIKYLIIIYELHGVHINTDLNAVIAYGHEQIITLNLANGVFDEIYIA